MLGGLPGSGLSKGKRDASQSLRAATFTCKTLAFHILEMTSLSTSIDSSFLKKRILRLWNLTVSSNRATIATQSPRGEGEGEMLTEDKNRLFTYEKFGIYII